MRVTATQGITVYDISLTRIEAERLAAILNNSDALWADQSEADEIEGTSHELFSELFALGIEPTPVKLRPSLRSR